MFRASPFPSRSKAGVLSALLALGSTACEEPQRVGADDPDPECVGKCDAGVEGAVPVAIRSASWDGRIVFGGATGDESDCRVMAVRPGRIDRSAGGVSFAPSVFSDGVACPTPLAALAVAAADLPGSNPFPSDAAGTPVTGGDHHGYALQVVAADDEEQLVLRRGLAVVAQPGTDDAEVISVEWDGGEVMLDAGGGVLEGEEPTITADGRLLVFRDGDALVYARAEGGAWTQPRPLTELFLEADVIVDGLTVAERWPLAARQLRGPDGRFLPPGSNYFGAQPWLSQDGAELLHTATVSGETGERDAAVSVIGQATGHGLRHLDGPINPSRDASASGRMSSAGRSFGLYAPYPEARTLPTVGHAPTYPVFGERGTYHEVDFEVFADRDYLVYLPMNENIATDGDFAIDVGRTPDLSGHFNTATVEAGASFLVDLDPEQDGNAGARGRAMYFTDDGVVSVPRDGTMPVPRWGLSTGLFVQRLVEADGSRPLLSWPGVLGMDLLEDGRVRASVVVGGSVREATTTAAVPVGAWTHVAMTYDGRRGSMALYVGGAAAGTGAFGPGMPVSATGDLLIGPAGGAEVPAGDVVLGIDEVSVSQIVRMPDEIFTAATGQVMVTMPLGGEEMLMGAQLPTGLEVADLQIPAWAPLRPEVVELGQLIFFDTRLSRNGQVSCATCHDPRFAFTDGRATALAIDGTDLPRATPTVFNRAMSMGQFWDARARTVESQALSPIGSPREMGFTIEEAVALLASSQEYVDRFTAAFGRGPDRNGIANAIATFERAQFAGDSPVDRFEAGELDALTEAEQRGRALFQGKARCVACHGGSNYTDERLHDVGLLSDNDLGAYFTSGGRLKNSRAFKTPTLRNIDVTGPYFHNGSVETLEEVVALYDAGPSGTGHDWESRALGLTAGEQADLVAFLRALTSPNAVQDMDVELPSIP
jgi:cytochrome c peroxidase